MTVAHLLSAVAVGVCVGAAGRFVVPAGRRVPFWVPMAAALGAALFATVLSRIADSHATGTSAVDLVMQVTFAVLGVTVVAATADRHPPDIRVTADPGDERREHR